MRHKGEKKDWDFEQLRLKRLEWWGPVWTLSSDQALSHPVRILHWDSFIPELKSIFAYMDALMNEQIWQVSVTQIFRFFIFFFLPRIPSVWEPGISRSVSTDLSSTTKSSNLAGWRHLRYFLLYFVHFSFCLKWLVSTAQHAGKNFKYELVSQHHDLSSRWRSLWKKCTEFIYASCSDTDLPKSVSVIFIPLQFPECFTSKIPVYSP